MFTINLQLFGGRGGASGGKRSGTTISFKKFTAKEIASMSKKQLATVAKAVFINKNTASGMKASEAARRFDLLVSGNSPAQLRKFIKNNQ